MILSFMMVTIKIMKDPAILFYTGDFMVGTFTMTDEQVGKYIRLLCLQHQKGILLESDMLQICKTYDKDVFSKFIKTPEGYYNERMKNEAERRKKYSESRAENRKQKPETPIKKGKKKTNKISSSYVPHMETEIENRDEIAKETYKSAVDFYFEFYKSNIGINPPFDGGDGKNMNELIDKLITSIAEKKENITAMDVLDAFKILLNKLPKFYKERIDIKVINNNYGKIIAEIRSKSVDAKKDAWSNILAERERERQAAAQRC